MAKNKNPWNKLGVVSTVSGISRQFEFHYEEGWPKQPDTRWVRKILAKATGKEVFQIDNTEILYIK